jgi:diguanylate cyclase (GGDEF)-like protein/PAS domain S-box-containing protein
LYCELQKHATRIETEVIERRRIAQEPRESERRFGDMLRNVELVSLMLDREARITYCNDYLLRLTGWRREEALGRDWFEDFVPPELDDAKDAFSALLADPPAAWHRESEILTRSGARRLIRWNNSVLRSDSGDVIGTASIGEDITERIHREEDLRRFREAMDATADAIFLIDRVLMQFVDVNDTACRMVGYTREALLELGPVDLGFGSRAKLVSLYDGIIANQAPRMVEVNLRRKDGSLLLVELSQRMQRSDEGWVIVGVARDMTERKEAEQRLLQLAHYDALTGLPNRTLFYESLKRAFAQAEEHHWIVSVLFLDLDRFKIVNDTLGHATGDALLRQVGNRLVSCLRIRDTVGRLGGDEFGLTLVTPDGPEGAEAVANKIREVLRPSFRLEGHEVTVTASIGITIYPTDSSDPDTLLKYADTAMYQAKEAGRDTYRFYTAEMNARALEKLDLESALRKALEHDEFILYYQPKMEINTGQWTGVEALIRWNRPGHGLVLPDNFIPILEETGLIMSVGEWVIDTACRQIAEWQRSGIGPICVAVNLSGKQFLSGFDAEIARAIRANRIDPKLLELELTETTLMTHAEGTTASLQRLKALGIRISIDDFGTGYSSLAYLKRFPIDTLKIDIAFIRDVTANTDDAAITVAIISMAHNLKLKVIAEGVEAKEQLEFLRSHDCDEVQGDYLSPPLPAIELARLYQETHASSAGILGITRR